MLPGQGVVGKVDLLVDHSWTRGLFNNVHCAIIIQNQNLLFKSFSRKIQVLPMDMKREVHGTVSSSGERVAMSF